MRRNTLVEIKPNITLKPIRIGVPTRKKARNTKPIVDNFSRRLIVEWRVKNPKKK